MVKIVVIEMVTYQQNSSNNKEGEAKMKLHCTASRQTPHVECWMYRERSSVLTVVLVDCKQHHITLTVIVTLTILFMRASAVQTAECSEHHLLPLL